MLEPTLHTLRESEKRRTLADIVIPYFRKSSTYKCTGHNPKTSTGDSSLIVSINNREFLRHSWFYISGNGDPELIDPKVVTRYSISKDGFDGFRMGNVIPLYEEPVASF
jgi:hypothetical protein